MGKSYKKIAVDYARAAASGELICGREVQLAAQGGAGLVCLVVGVALLFHLADVIEIAEDVKRYYPLGAFLSHVLGSTTDDNQGLSGLELKYNQYLSGIDGRWIKNKDIAGRSLAYGVEKYYQAEDGLSLVLTIDEVIQHYVEKAIGTVQANTQAKRVLCLVMDPRTGDVRA